MKAMLMIRTLRPPHWVKNGLVLAPAFFSGGMGDTANLKKSGLAFLAFCAAASAVYIFNDLMDKNADAGHARKRLRPYASGALARRDMIVLLIAAAGLAAVPCAALPRGVAFMIAAYAAAMILYTVFFKRCWWAGALCISGGMLARVFAGAAAIDVCVSRWVLPCTFLLTCYVVLGKRLYDTDAETHTPAFRFVFHACGAAALACYAVYCLYDATMLKYDSRWVIVSALPAGAALWRYARAMPRPSPDREHLQAIVSDPVIAACIALWFAVFAVIIYI